MMRRNHGVVVAALVLAVAGCGEAGGAMPAHDAGAGDAHVAADGSPAGDGDSAVGGDGGSGGSPFAVRVVSFSPGDGAGFGQDAMPEIVLGPPKGRGDANGSLDVVSLGTEGEIVLELGRVATDGEGPDLLVFENPFVVGSSTFAEPGRVAVSEDGEAWTEFPCDRGAAPEYPGCAGVEPVYANPEENDIDPTDPETAGGDAFDFADIGVSRARFVRIRDAGKKTGLGGDSEGFDLDAVAVVH